MNSDDISLLAERMGWIPDTFHTDLGPTDWMSDDDEREFMVFTGALTDAGAFQVMIWLLTDYDCFTSYFTDPGDASKTMYYAMGRFDREGEIQNAGRVYDCPRQAILHAALSKIRSESDE